MKRLDELNKKLDTLIKVVAISARMETILKEKSKKDQIRILSRLGLSRDIIALILGTTPLTVSVRLSELKKGKQSKSKERKGGKSGKNK